MRTAAYTWWGVVVNAISIWLDRNAFMHAGSLAYCTLFSMAPIVIIAVAVAGVMFGQEAARGELVGQFARFGGAEAGVLLENAVARSRIEVAGLMPTVIGLIALLAGATTVFAQLQSSLNAIWGVTAKPRKNALLSFLTARLLSLSIVLAVGLVLVVSLFVNVALEVAVRYAGTWIPFHAVLLSAINLVVSLAVATLLFAAIFRILPDVDLAWGDVWVGAAITAGLFTIGRYLIAMYLAYTAPESAYGAAGSLVLLLVWVYYSSLILLLGAAITAAHTKMNTPAVPPNALAASVSPEPV